MTFPAAVTLVGLAVTLTVGAVVSPLPAMFTVTLVAALIRLFPAASKALAV
ncbi:hypothetical protein [Deinococcus xianganensis]|uniref:hypothetical protein n=1 Tax=Deinococcus xianganensis TaxID=1507289 RepID=UPI00301C7C34